MKALTTVLLACLATVAAQAQKFEGLALTPPMGWNTWNTFASNISESLVKETAQTMIESGMRDAGYQYIVLDDCWMLRERDPEGNLVADPDKFPSGMKALGDYLHEHGFKFGIYNCAGTKTCAGYPGGRGHEYQDARLYASWGVDYLKYDWCNTGSANAPETYKTMRDALYAAGRPIVFSLCEWGTAKPWEWASDIGHLWRTTGDIIDCYDCVTGWSRGWKAILDMQVELAQYAGPGHWNDPDMMEVGNEGLSVSESRAHFSFWCMLAAPLMAGNDVRHMTEATRTILTNKEAIAIDQDPLGKQGTRFYRDSQMEIWTKQLADGKWAVCLLNAGSDVAELTIEWERMQYLLKGQYDLRNVWTGTPAGDTGKPLTVKLGSHDVALLTLTPKA